MANICAFGEHGSYQQQQHTSIRFHPFLNFVRVASAVKYCWTVPHTPSAVKLRIATEDDHGVSRCRVYFLCRSQHDCSLPPSLPTLFTAEVTSADSELSDEQPIWRSIIAESIVNDRSIHTSLAEDLLRERMRMSSMGVAAFELDESGRLVITASGRTYSMLDSTPLGCLPDEQEPMEAPVFVPLQPTICPCNSDLIACVSSVNLAVGHAPSNRWTCVTKFTCDTGLSVGMPSFVVQEELDRYVGFWWRPRPVSNDQNASGKPGRYQILYELVDERMVDEVNLLCEQQIEKYRYPKAGTKNAVSDLRICEFDVLPTGEITNVRHLALPQPLFQYLPGFEYLVRAGWTPDGSYVWCQLLTRAQDKLDLMLIPLENFNHPLSDNTATATTTAVPAPNQTLSSDCIRLIQEEQIGLWIQVHDRFAWTAEPLHSSYSISGAENHMTFVWSSHRSGYSHLYLCQRSWPKSGSTVSVQTTNQSPASVIDARDCCTVQLTDGPWEVTGNRFWLDETNQLVYFEGNREHPILQHIYAVSYAPGNASNVTLLSQFELINEHSSDSANQINSQSEQFDCVDPTFPIPVTGFYPFSYTIETIDTESGWAVISSSSLDHTRGVCVVRIRQRNSKPIMEHVAWLSKHVQFEQTLRPGFPTCGPPHVVRFNVPRETPSENTENMSEQSPADHESNRIVNETEVTLYGQLYLPKHLPRPPAGYPTIHYVYGGPSVQLAQGHYSRSILLHALLYCHFGYAVFVCDARGSANRGVQFAGHLMNRLGQVELDDHIAFLKHVASSTKLIDLSRVAITGYSYGGYLSLMGGIRYSHIYKAALAGSPVVDWMLYDTAYTERYLGLPEEHAVAYTAGNVYNYVHLLPADKTRLLISHGAMDENVHFMHTSHLIERLESMGKPYRLSYHPNSRHSIRSSEHLEATFLMMLQSLFS